MSVVRSSGRASEQQGGILNGGVVGDDEIDAKCVTECVLRCIRAFVVPAFSVKLGELVLRNE